MKNPFLKPEIEVSYLQIDNIICVSSVSETTSDESFDGEVELPAV